MSTTDTLDKPQMGVVKLNVTDQEIAKMKADYLILTINGIEDRAGLKKVYESRQIVKKTRISLEKHADELKEEAISWQKKVNTEKGRVVGELKSIEDHLQSEEDKVEAEKERIRKEEEAKETARIQARIDTLAGYGFGIDYGTVTTMDDAAFEIALENARIDYEKDLADKAEKERLEKEEQARIKAEREELEKLRAERAAQDRVIAEQKAELDRKEAEEKRRQDEEERLKKEREEQRIKQQWNSRIQQLDAVRTDGSNAYAGYDPSIQIATWGQLIGLSDEDFAIMRDAHNAENAKAIEAKRVEDERKAAEAEERRQAEVKRLQDEAAAKAIADRQAEEEEKERQEAERLAQASDREKFNSIVSQFEAITYPEMKSAKAKKLLAEVKELNAKIVSHIRVKF